MSDELPAEFVIHPRIVVSRKTGEKLRRQARTAKPKPALRKLMRAGKTRLSRRQT